MLWKVTAYLIALALIPVGFVTGAAPATVAEAAKKLDLVTLPLPDGAVVPGHRREAELSYRVKSSAQVAFNFAHEQLVERGWQPLPDAQNHGEFINANYGLDGFAVYLSVSPRESGEVGVILTHKGNVKLEDVPVPDNVEKMYAFPAIVMYKSPDSVSETADACRERMLADGWSPYGGAGTTHYYRKNAVQVDFNVMVAPGQGFATVISISSKLLSLELPAPPFAEGFRYSDGTTAIDLDTDKTPQEVADYYREQLGPLGWKATTEKPVEIKWKKYTIFRNAGQEMITVATHDFEGRTRVHLDHQNAAEVADEELRGLIAAGEKAKYRDKQWLPVKVPIPSGLAVAQLEDWAIKIPTSQENAFKRAKEIATYFVSAGWTSEPKTSDRPAFRSYRFEGQERVVHLLVVRPPKREPWIAVVGIGGVVLKPIE